MSCRDIVETFVMMNLNRWQSVVLCNYLMYSVNGTFKTVDETVFEWIKYTERNWKIKCTIHVCADIILACNLVVIPFIIQDILYTMMY